MLQSAIANPEVDESNLKDAWKIIPQDKIIENKLKCVFDNDRCTEE